MLLSTRPTVLRSSHIHGRFKICDGISYHSWEPAFLADIMSAADCHWLRPGASIVQHCVHNHQCNHHVSAPGTSCRIRSDMPTAVYGMRCMTSRPS